MSRVTMGPSVGRGCACSFVILIALLLGSAVPAWGEEAAPCPLPCPDPCEVEGLLPVPEYRGRLCRRPNLTGDWCGTRTRWAKKGVFFDFDWLQVAQGTVKGGTRERWAYGTNLDLRATFDLQRMGVVPGAVVSFRAQSRFGETVNGDSGLLLPVNTMGAFPLTDEVDEDIPVTITELNWLQFLSEKFAVLFGKITTMSVANDFAGGEGRSQFMNFQFVFPAVMAQIGPYSTLAAGVVWMPSPNVSVTSLILNTTDSSTNHGFDDFDKGQTWWTSATFKYEISCLPGGVTVGGGYAFNGDFARIGGLNLDPSAGTVTLGTKSDTWAVFASGWQYLHLLEKPRDLDPEDGRQDLRGLGVFGIVGVGDEDANPVKWSIAGGLSGRGLIPGRCDDTCGLGAFYNEIGDPAARSLLGAVLDGSSSGAEAYYNIALMESVALTFDAQWLNSGLRGVDDAFLLGCRLNVNL